MKLFELRRDLADKQLEGRAIVDKAIAESRATNPEEDTQIQAIRAQIKDLISKITLFEARDSFDAMAPEERDAGGRLGPDLPELDDPRHRFSALRAMNMFLQQREGKGRFEGLEAEVHQELNKERLRNNQAPAQGVLIPWTLGQRSEKRAADTTAVAGSIAAILGMPMIDLLRNKMVMYQMGAKVLTGLVGSSFSLPKQTAASTAYYVAESTDITTSNPTIGQVTFTPHTVGTVIPMSRKALLQTSLDLEAVLRDDLARVIAIEMDRAGVNGSGSSNQPTGILQDTNSPTVAVGTNGGDPTWALILQLETAVATANADFGSLGYLTSNKARGKMKNVTKIASSQYSDFLWQKGEQPGFGEVNSYRALSSQQVPSNLTKGSSSGVCSALIFGNFGSSTFGFWGGVDMMIDPYTGSKQGTVNFIAMQDFDYQSRYATAFNKIVDLTTV